MSSENAALVSSSANDGARRLSSLEELAPALATDEELELELELGEVKPLTSFDRNFPSAGAAAVASDVATAETAVVGVYVLAIDLLTATTLFVVLEMSR
jgi:hypothetical protein